MRKRNITLGGFFQPIRRLLPASFLVLMIMIPSSACSPGASPSADTAQAHIEAGDRHLAAGRYDGAQVTAWLVNWDDPALRQIVFRGSIGEISRAGGAFKADVRCHVACLEATAMATCASATG